MNLPARLLVVSTVAVTAFAGVNLGTAASAAAVDLNVNSPERVVINQAYEWVSWRVGGPNKSQLEIATVNLEHAATRQWVDFDWAEPGALSGRFKVYDWDVKPGRHKVWLEDPVDHDYEPMTAKADFIVIKFGSRATLRTWRQGRKVTLHSRTTRYNGTWGEWRAFRNTVVRFERKTADGWKLVARDAPNRRGHAQVTIRRAKPAKYRAVVRGTAGVWKSRSATKRR